MKKLLLLAIILLSAMSTKLFAQCPGCILDTTQTVVGIYPDTLPAGIVNTAYDQDITFVMFTDTLGLTVNTFQIVSVGGLPQGLSWECNNIGTGCVYDPSLNVRGCVKICGTPTQIGFFNMVVTVIANIQLVGDQTVTFVRPFIVMPAGGGNAGFTFAPGSGCDSATIQFNSVLSAYGYNWDLGNGQTDTIPNPVGTYSTTGDYPVVMQAVIAYRLDSITAFSVPDNYNELGFLDPDPDLYFTIRDTTGAAIYTTAGSSVTDATFPLTWVFSNLTLTDQIYTLSMSDEDNVLLAPDDDLASVSWNGLSPTGTVTGTLSGVGGQLEITYYSSPVYYDVYDTVHVYPSPVVLVSSLYNDTLCSSDSALLTVNANPNDLVQWYNDTVILIGANAADLWVNQTGNYWATVGDVNGCQGNSPVYIFTSVPNPPKPTYSVIGSVLTCYLIGYDLQWYVNGAAIPGATDTVWTAVTPGLYNVVATNQFGCTTSSDTVLLTGVGMYELNEMDFSFALLPNNGDGIFDLILNANENGQFEILISDLNGKVVERKNIFMQSGNSSLKFNLTDVTNGVYSVQVKSGSASQTLRYVKLK